MHIKQNIKNSILNTTFYKSLKNKNILLDKIKLFSNFPYPMLFANIFFRYKKSNKYKKKISIHKMICKGEKKVCGLRIHFYFNLLNQKINQTKASMFFQNFIKMKEIIFVRRPDLFSDFLI